jgi:radical SAM superfamily enzyme YgiQ (UPF0313 family)
VTLVRGEVEDTWAGILRDVASGTQAPLYDTSGQKPDLATAPLPRLHPPLMKHFVYRHFGTIDTSRGCPFSCSFCTIINVQGRQMRARDAGTLAAAIEANYRATGTHHYFLTDDDFARNRDWRAVLTELIRLREEVGIPLRFLMQADVLAHRIPDFVELSRRAGCFQVFIGMESLNPQSLADGGKRQNRVADYAAMIETWRAAGILTHVGYIIGFPSDSPESVREDVRTLRDTLGVDLAAFFMLTPLPGSADYAALQRERRPMDEDLNRYDTFHPVVDHPRMTREIWYELYREAWREFYSREHMRRQLARRSGREHIALLQMYLWYKSAVIVDDFHPMMTGFVRRKPRRDRRPGTPVEGRVRHLRRRLPELYDMVTRYARVLRELRDVWAETTTAAEGAGGTGLGGPQSLRRWRGFAGSMFGALPDPALPRSLGER